ncbi:septum formation protein Maf [bacterium]|nr:septum formation protein Maf [candidate division CSSED10-310 bacterium]
MNPTHIILASRSPRRKALLDQFGIPYIAVEPRCKESGCFNQESPSRYARRLALEKAHDVASRFPDQPVLGADTIVVDGKTILGKPASVEDGMSMLMELAGRGHSVITGLALIKPGMEPVVSHSETRVEFRRLSRDEIEWYGRTRDGLDKAGAYGIQSLGGALVREIHGDWFNVVGLPIPLLIDLLLQFCPELWPPRN